MGSKISRKKKEEATQQANQPESSVPVLCPFCSLTFPPEDVSHELMKVK